MDIFRKTNTKTSNIASQSNEVVLPLHRSTTLLVYEVQLHFLSHTNTESKNSCKYPA